MSPNRIESPRMAIQLISDSTGETLEMIAKAGLARFEGADAVRYFWPMVRSEGHLDRVLLEIERKPGLVIYTLVDGAVRQRLEQRCAALGMPMVSPLDPTINALSEMLGLATTRQPGRQHTMDSAYFRRVAAIHYTMVHDDGAHADDLDEADIVLLGVSRTSKTPTSIYLANRGFRTANVPLVPQSPPPASLFGLTGPLLVGLTTAPDRLALIRRNRLLSLGQAPDTDYVDPEQIEAEVAFARRLFADHDIPVIDVTRRSIEETAAAIINLHQAKVAREDAAAAAAAGDGASA